MTESEWNISTDLAAMLDWISGYRGKGFVPDRLSNQDRILRLFACAVARANGHDPESIAHVESCVEAGQPNHNFNDQEAIDRGQFWRRCWSVDAARGAAHAYPGASTANILRDIVGNPRRLVTTYETGPRGDWTRCSWITPLVLDLARAAYQERVGQKCERCVGTGVVSIMQNPCPTCHGTGRITDGSLDPLRLLVLADALEEGGGCTNEVILRHLRGWEEVLLDPNVYEPDPQNNMLRMTHCWKRSNQPHFRGCWVLDLLLGKE